MCVTLVCVLLASVQSTASLTLAGESSRSEVPVVPAPQPLRGVATRQRCGGNGALSRLRKTTVLTTSPDAAGHGARRSVHPPMPSKRGA